jgi:excinuclease ABC subunit A
LTEIDDYMRLLFAKLGDSYCHSCGKEIKPSSVDAIMGEIKKDYIDKRIFLLKEA